MNVTFPRNAAGKGVFHARLAAVDDLEELDQARKHIERLEACNHHGQPVALDELLEHFGARDRCCVACREETFDLGLWHLGDDLHHRWDVLVRGKHGEVVRRIIDQDRCRGHRRRFESRRKEDDLLIVLACELHRLRDAVHDVDTGAFCLCVRERL